MAIDTKSLAHLRMAERWPLLHSLMEGTQGMRDRGEELLPREENEGILDYHRRLKRTFLYRGLKGAHERLVAEPFRKAVTLGGDPLEGILAEIESRADLDGRNLTAFARSVFGDMVLYGLGHVLVDMPSVSTELTLAEERALGVRPYFARIAPPDLLGWTVDEAKNLTRVRIRETTTEIDESFEERTIERVRMIERDRWMLFEDRSQPGTQARPQWDLVAEGPNTLGRVPLLTGYWGDADGPLEATPPLMDLAWTNLAHWQSSSDQRNILHVARVPFLWAAGWTAEEIERGISVGVSKLAGSENPDAKLSWVEHTGAAIEAGERDLTKLEEHMEALGAQPMLQRSVNVTATAKTIDEGHSQSSLQAAVRALEGLLLDAYKLAGDWVGETVADDFGVDVFSEFTLSLRSSEHLEILDKARARGDMPLVQYWSEAKRRGVIDEATDIEAMVAEVEEEGRQAMEVAMRIGEPEPEPEPEPAGASA